MQTSGGDLHLSAGKDVTMEACEVDSCMLSANTDITMQSSEVNVHMLSAGKDGCNDACV